MTRQNSDQDSNRGGAGTAHKDAALNFGSARSDYGSRAYGGHLDAAGLDRRDGADRRTNTASVSARGDYNPGAETAESSNRRSSRRTGAWTNKGAALLLGGLGLGLGGTLAYVFGSRRQTSHAHPSATRGGSDVMVKCGEVMTKDPSCCLPSDTVERAAQLMKMENVGPVPVVGDLESRQLVGFVTDRDLAIKVVADARDPKSTRVSEVMSTGISTCRREDDLQKALNLMEEHQVRRIPIVDEGNRIVGIIAQADVATRVEAPHETAELVEEISRSSAAAGAR